MSRLGRFWIGATAILIVAFALRLYHLDFRALWWDEGLSLFFARLGFFENAAYAVRLADIDPPFYRLILGAWASVCGSSAFATRAFSVYAGLITVAATLRLARDWGGWQTALIAGGLAAASPMLVYYSQEAKAYSLVAACGTLSIILWLRMLSSRRERLGWWMAYGLLLAIPLGAHYITIFLIAVQAGWTALVVSRQAHRAASQSSVVNHPPPGGQPTVIGRPRSIVTRLAYFTAALALAAAAQVPFWALTFSKTSAAVRGETGVFTGLRGPVEFFGAHAMEFAVGPGAGTEGTHGNEGTEGNGYWGAAAALLAMALVGLFCKPPAPSSHISGFPYFPYFLLSLIAFPLLAGFAFNNYLEFFFPRFLLYSVPPFLLLAAAGLGGLLRRSTTWRVIGLALAAIVAANWVLNLARHYANPGDPSEDWRPVAAGLRGHTQANDAAIYVWAWMPGYLHAYLPPSPEPEYYLGFYTPEALAPELAAIAAGHSRVWLLDYRIDQFDVRNAAGRWLGERSALVYDQWFGNAHVALFLPADRLPAPAADAPTAEFANGLKLRWSPVHASARPGDAIGVHLEWTAPPERIARRHTVFLHGLAADGSLAFGRDSEPVNGLRPTDAWTSNETVRDPRGVLLPTDLPPGDYTLEIGLYDTVTGEVVMTLDRGQAVSIGSVIVR
ncbi:MAG: glycosyltransferase family 39 protein [Chloroflexi bacterium]|nr:glycosyltransferase family 39 protein [Chloroflexota bacterium]